MLPAVAKSSKKSSKSRKSVKKKALTEDAAAQRVQCLVRRFLARRRIRSQAQVALLRVFDPAFKRYFWYNQFTKHSTWKQPKFVDLFTEVDVAAVTRIQKLLRGFLGRRRARQLANGKYVRYFDAETGRFYWFNRETNATTYTVSPWLERMQVDMPAEDKLLFQSFQRIQELERKLQEKEQEIKVIRKQRYEELEPLVIKDKVKSVKNLERSRHMDEWTMDDLAAWFTELKMEEYIPSLFANRVDGALFVNLTDDEFFDLGIRNRFHLRKLQLILKAYRIRYQRKQNNKQQDDAEDDLLSEYSPSELSEVIANEDAPEDGDSNSGSSDRDDEDEDDNSEENEEERITAEQNLQRRMDEENIYIDMVMKGDGINFPLVGDIVRVRYTCTLASTNKVVMSSKNTLERPWVEFVLGVDQVIKGFDRALPLMSIGERSKLTFTPEYAYGTEGLPPHIPPNSSLIFDLTLLGFRQRSQWVKPLLQDSTTNEFPYHSDMKVSLQLAKRSGMERNALLIYSTSMLLNDDEIAGILGKSTTKLT